MPVVDPLSSPNWQLVITERGGGGHRHTLPFSSLDFDRTLNNFSSARVNLPTTGEARDFCCDVLSGQAFRAGTTTILPVDVWSHELNLFADGYLAWAGPLYNMTFNREQNTLMARDLFQWYERRYLHTHDRFFTGDLATIFNNVHDDAMELDDSPNINVTAKPTGINMELDVIAKDWPKAADLMRTLFNTGLDFVAVGRDIYIGGVELLLPDVIPIWDPFALVAELDRRGSDLATSYGVTGELADDRVSVHVGDVDTTYGLLELHETDLDIREDESALAAATSRWDLLHVPPNYVECDLTPEGPHIKHLIPGSHCDVRLSGKSLGCRDIRDEMRLSSVKVSVNVEDNKTKASLTLTPLGRVGT